ncbi:MAG: hypothetical protein NC177_13715 [Ruminococcus flavefaciens]|nr:hypothetical protein [Ruminococcus flavefaciens]
MDDLLFKNIPTEGFDPNCGFTDRISNPTPSRNSQSNGVSSVSKPDDRLSSWHERPRNSTGYSEPTDRLSNATPSRRNTVPNYPVDQGRASSFDESDRMSSVVGSRLSNTNSDRGNLSVSPQAAPVANGFNTYDDMADRMSSISPTRRGSSDGISVPPPLPAGEVEEQRTVDATDFSRASNPTPTRRESTSNPYETFSDLPIDGDSRVSNPTPTRRRQNAFVEQPVTFASFGSEIPEEVNRISNPTPTRRDTSGILGSTIQTSKDSDIQSRMSSTTPTRREKNIINPFVDSTDERTEPLSFSSADDPYGVSSQFGAEGSRASNPTPTRRQQVQETPIQYDNSNFSDDRLSNCAPSNRKRGGTE